MRRIPAIIRWLGRTLAIVVLVMIGSTVLVRYAPGYLSDPGEMDARYAHVIRAELSEEAARSHSVTQMLITEITGMTRGAPGSRGNLTYRSSSSSARAWQLQESCYCARCFLAGRWPCVLRLSRARERSRPCCGRPQERFYSRCPPQPWRLCVCWRGRAVRFS